MGTAISVLVVSGGGYQGLALIKCLRGSAAIRIVMVDSAEVNICKYMVDRFQIVPPVKEREKFISSLLEICEEEDVDIIFPSTGIELLVLAENLELFRGKNILVAVSKPYFLSLLLDKRQLYDLLLKKGFPALPMLDITDDVLTFPLLGKPVHGWGGKELVVLHSRADLSGRDIPSLQEQYVWQPFLKEFEEYSVDCAIGFDGTISEIIIRKRLSVVGGFAVIAENADDLSIKEMSEKFMALAGDQGGCGIFNLQILKRGADYFISDINPRIGTSAVFMLGIGVNLPLFLCSYANPAIYPIVKQESPSIKNVKMVRYLEELWVERGSHDDIKAVVFDLDDTLFNQKQWILGKLEIVYSLLSDYLPEKRVFLLKAIQIIEEGNRSKLFDALSQEFNFNETLREQLIKTYRKSEPPMCPLYPEVTDVLGQLRKMGLKLALLTDNPVESQKQKVKGCRLEELFDAILYSRESGDEKPEPAVFGKMVDMLGMKAHELIMVGDNLYRDVNGALAAGYGFAYWIERPGTFFNFEPHIFERFFPDTTKMKRISNLRDIVWALRSDA